MEEDFQEEGENEPEKLAAEAYSPTLVTIKEEEGVPVMFSEHFLLGGDQLLQKLLHNMF